MDKRLIDNSDCPDEHVKADLDPIEAIKLVRRLRRVTFFLRVRGELVTERNEDEGTYRAYDMTESVDVSARQAIKVLERWAEFNDRKMLKGDKPGKIEVTRLGGCLFIG